MSVSNATSVGYHPIFSSTIPSNDAEVESLMPNLQSVSKEESKPLASERITACFQKGKNKIVEFVTAIDPHSISTDPSEKKKQDCRNKLLAVLAYIFGIGTGITVLKEKSLAKRLKLTTDPSDRYKLLKEQKNFRIAATVRTVSSVVLALLLIIVSMCTGGLSVGIGLVVMGGALALGSGFTGHYINKLQDSKAKLKQFEWKKDGNVESGG